MIRGIFLVIFLPALLLGKFNPISIINLIEHIKEGKKGERFLYSVKGVFDENSNLWLFWRESDERKISLAERFMRESKGERVPYEDLFSYEYIQKFDKNGKPIFPQVEISKYRPTPNGGIGFSRLYLGNSNDIYFFPGAYFRVFRVDNKGNLYKSEKSYKHSVYFGEMFIDSSGKMHVFSEGLGRIDKYTKFKLQNPLPILLEEKDLSILDTQNQIKSEYRWVYSRLKYCDPKGKYTLFVNIANEFLKSSQRKTPWIDTTRLYIYKIRWSDLKIIDSFSFRISDALHKKIMGCKLKLKSQSYEQGVLEEGNGDTLLLYLPCRDTLQEIVDLVYLCKIKKDGTPIKAMEVKEEEVKGFNSAPNKLHLEIAFWGMEFGHSHRRTYIADPFGGPNGMMIYGFDKSGNIYYYVWDKSDDYWKNK